MTSARKSVVFWDSEVSVGGRRVMDIGAVCTDGSTFHSSNKVDFKHFVQRADYACGHNIFNHDLNFLGELFVGLETPQIDTLYLSTLLFPKKPYHHLVKDEKIISEEFNDPVGDSKKCQLLFYELLQEYLKLPQPLQSIYCALLAKDARFCAFFQYLGIEKTEENIEELVLSQFRGLICEYAPITQLLKDAPVELAYSLALINTQDRTSIFPPWLLRIFPKLEDTLIQLREVACVQGCYYCKSHLNLHSALKRYFGYDKFRTYANEPLQQNAAQAAVNGESLLAIFPTGGGKSLTFQLPALMAGECTRGLTVVISPLQSLMKDQVDHLIQRGILEAVTINGMLNPLERSQSYEQIYNGNASILYISPEQLRSKTLENALLSRHISRFVIDEAHCFSSWGHDFRVDYLYIGDFINQLQEKKSLNHSIPVSCFTATAKPKVIQDIQDYFRDKLNSKFSLFVSDATRENLRYRVWYEEDEDKKYNKLRDLIEECSCPTIVYVSRVAKTEELATRLSRDGFPSLPYNGQMNVEDKSSNQENFIAGKVPIMVATNAFGMGVDKKDVGLVVHYDISASLENYVQEAGRAGRDPMLSAQCHILFNERDLDRHFLQLNQMKLSLAEIQQIWQAIKAKTRYRSRFCCSALELARDGGWKSDLDVETRVKTALAALEHAGYIVREQNVPRVFANSIQVGSVIEAQAVIDQSGIFTSDEQKTIAKRIISSLITKWLTEVRPESRIDYLADNLGLEKSKVIESITLMRQANLLSNDLDMSAYIFKTDTEKKSLGVLKTFIELERFLIQQLGVFNEKVFNLKELNGIAIDQGFTDCTVKKIRKILTFIKFKGYLAKVSNHGQDCLLLIANSKTSELEKFLNRRTQLAKHILEELYQEAQAKEIIVDGKDRLPVKFSVVSLLQSYQQGLVQSVDEISVKDIEDALLYLAHIDALRIEGGFLVLYQSMSIVRKELDNYRKFKRADYRQLDDYYKLKIQQIHIVGRYANLMMTDYQQALQYVYDYFHLEYEKFLNLSGPTHDGSHFSAENS